MTSEENDGNTAARHGMKNKKSIKTFAQELKTKQTFKGSKEGALHQLQKLLRSCTTQSEALSEVHP